MTSRWARLHISAVTLAGAAIVLHAIWVILHTPWVWSFNDQGRYLFYLVVALAASAVKISLPSVTGTMSMNFLFVLIGVSEFSIGQTLIMGCLGILVQSLYAAKKRPRAIQVTFNVASMACSIQATYAVNRLAGVQNTIVSATTFFVANTLLVAVVIAVTEGKNVWRVWREAYFWSFPNYLVGASAAWVVTVASHQVGWQAGLLLLPIFYVIYRSHSSYMARLEEARKREEERRVHAEEVAALHRRTIETLAIAIEAKDQTTHDHLARVETYAVEVARDLHFSETELEALRAAALLHDVGKIAVPEYIISKPGKLTPEEFEIMKTHTVVGAELVERIRFPYSVAPLVRGHHEKWNGSGYPDGLQGENIPIGARILAAVDTLDALASDRPYRRALPLNEAIEVILKESGKSFDPRVVDVLARRYVELERLASSSIRMRKLSTNVKIERGDAPAAGFESSAGPAASDLANIQRSLAESEERGRAVAKLCTALSESADRAAAFAVLRRQLAATIPYDAMAVYRRQTSVLVAELACGDAYLDFLTVEGKVAEGVTGWVAENGKPILNGNPSVEPGYVRDRAKFAALGSAVSVPLMNDSGIAGAISLYRRGADAFSKDDLGALTVIAAALADVFHLAHSAA